MGKLVPWSFSSLEAFKTCPRQWAEVKFYKHVEETKHEATLWGTKCHEALEYRVRDKAPLTGEFAQYESLAAVVEAIPGRVLTEYQMAVNRSFQPCEWNDPEVWCRGIADVLVVNDAKGTAAVLDWKTGKKKPELRQLKLFALLVFAHFPEVTHCRTAFIWLKTGERTMDAFTRDQQAEYWQDFLPDVKAFEQATTNEKFIPKPSGLCNGWCPVTGCDFWKPKRRK